MSETEKIVGTVKFFNTTKGYGFIQPDGDDKDIFVHISAVENSGLRGLHEGDKVSFNTQEDSRGRGPQAVNITMA